MGIRRLFGRGKKNWLDEVSVDELQKELMKIDNKIEVLSRRIKALEEEKKKLFNQGIGKSNIEKMLLAEKIKDVDNEIKMLLRDYNRLMKLRRAMSNLIRLKKWEGRLKETGIWNKLSNLAPEELINRLSDVKWTEDNFEKNLDQINTILGAEYAQVAVDSETREIFELWDQVEKSELTPEAVDEKLAVKAIDVEESKEREKEAH